MTSVSVQGATTVSPEIFTIQGSNNGSNWDTLESVFGHPNNNALLVNYPLTTPGLYSFYRLHFTDSHHPSYVGLNEVEFYFKELSNPALTVLGEGTVLMNSYGISEITIGPDEFKAAMCYQPISSGSITVSSDGDVVNGELDLWLQLSSQGEA